MKKITHLESYNAVPRKGIFWRAIFAGTLTFVSIMLILNLFGLAAGLGSINPTEETNPLSGLGTGTVIWWVLSCLIALFAGGFVAARVGISFNTTSGIIHGIMTWALCTLVSAWLFTSAIGSIISGVGNLVGNVLSTTGQAVGNRLGPVIDDQFEQLNISLDEAKDEFYALLEDTGKEELDPEELEAQAGQVAEDASKQVQDAARQPGSVNSRIEETFSNAGNIFEGTFEAVDQEALVNVLMERTNMSENEAKQTVENYLATYENLRADVEEFLQNTEEQAKETAENIAEAVATASLYLAIALVLGAITAAAGGFLGIKNLREDYEKTDYIAEDIREDSIRH